MEGVNTFWILNLTTCKIFIWMNTEGTCTHRLILSLFQNTRPSLCAPLKKRIFNSQSFPFKGKSLPLIHNEYYFLVRLNIFVHITWNCLCETISSLCLRYHDEHYMHMEVNILFTIQTCTNCYLLSVLCHMYVLLLT